MLYVKGLEHNLLRMSQLCTNGYQVIFNKKSGIVKDSHDKRLLVAHKCINLYKIDIDDLADQRCIMFHRDDR